MSVEGKEIRSLELVDSSDPRLTTTCKTAKKSHKKPQRAKTTRMIVRVCSSGLWKIA